MAVVSILGKLKKDETGSMLTATALMFPAIIGFAGVGLDVSNWYLNQRSTQKSADVGAMQAGFVGTTEGTDNLSSRVKSYMSRNDLLKAHDTVTVSTPPTKGPFAGRANHFEVIVRRDVSLHFTAAFANMVGKSLDVDVGARSVSGTAGAGEQCVVAFNETARRAINVTGGAEVDADCGVMSNSTAADAISVSGSAELEADSVFAVGEISVTGGGEIDSTAPPAGLTTPVPDPFSQFIMPKDSPCDFDKNYKAKDGEVLVPGRYCGGLTIGSGVSVTLEPGLYIMDAGGLVVNGGASMEGESVTFAFVSDISSKLGDVRINGGSSVSLSAPVLGKYRGMLFLSDPNNSGAKNDAVFNGGADLHLEGAIYMPHHDVVFNGGSEVDESSCLRIFAGTVEFSGNSVIGNNEARCEQFKLNDRVVKGRVALVE